MIRRIKEYFNNTSLAERVFTFIALALLIITALFWFVGTYKNNNSSSQVLTGSKTQNSNNVLAAEKAVKELEESNTDKNLLNAQAAVDKLTEKSKKEALQKRIDTVTTAMKKKTEEIQKAKLKAELVRAEAAKKLAEEQNKPNEEIPASSSTEEAQAAEVPTETDSYVAEDSYVYEESYTYQPVYGGGQSSSTSSSSSAPQQSSTPSQPSAPAPVVEEPVVTPPSSLEEVAPSEPEPVAPSSSETDSTVDSSASGE
ncbi:TPA: hypothetical protein ACGO2N_000124 [Streptococcus suis]